MTPEEIVQEAEALIALICQKSEVGSRRLRVQLSENGVVVCLAALRLLIEEAKP